MQHMGQKTRRAVVASRQRGATALSRPRCLYRLWHPSGRGAVADAPSAEVTLLSENFVSGIPLRIDDSLDIRVQHPAVRPPISNLLKARCQFLQVTLLTRAGFQTVTTQGIAVTERDKQVHTELRRASAMALSRCVVSGYATVWAESFEGSVSGHQSWYVLCRYRCRLLLAEIPKGVDRNSELKQRLQLWEIGANQRSDLQGPGSAEFWTAAQNSTEGCSHRQTNSAGSEPVP